MAIFRQQACMVSRAWYPARSECCVSVSRTAQMRRALRLFIGALWQIFQVKHRQVLREQQKVSRVWQEQLAPETPMPEAPLMRFLETYDLSASDIKHFIDSKTDLKAIPNSTAGTLQESIQQ